MLPVWFILANLLAIFGANLITFFSGMKDKMYLAFGDISDLDRIFKEHKINGTYPLDFINEVKQDEQRVNSVIFLGQKQLDIVNKIFGNDIGSEQRAFEDFGQGLLYDDRCPRPVNNRVHMMDEGQFGFYRWHTFIRTAVLLNQDPKDGFMWTDMLV
ncbi:MAG: hypothetical protein E6K94_09565 [Thaumarchaeota archaeon]|nr:MAG: hypothetical protein E6K94_09565 [Nitrososphaerota archaeon]